MRLLRLARKPQSTRLADTVHAAAVDDGMTLLDSRRGTLFHLSQSGSVVMIALAEDDANLDTAIEALTSRYGIGQDQARADVIGLVNELRSRGLLAR